MWKRFFAMIFTSFAVTSIAGLTLLALALGIFVVSLSGCGKQEYKKVEYAASASAPGFRVLPGRVDILIVPDNTGSITSAFTTVQGQLSGFISDLQNKGWDYHVARSPINNPGPITQVLVNPNFNNSTLSDGSPNPSTDLVPPQYAVTDPSQFQLLTGVDASNGSQDYTYQNSYNNLAQAKSNTTLHFLRDDAILAVVVLTNGADYTVDPDTRGDDINLSATGPLANWAAAFKSLKSFPQLVRFYGISADSAMPINGQGCLVPGGPALIGLSYSYMLNFLPGLHRNFCDSTAMSSVLSDIENDIVSTQQSYVYSYLVMDQEPVPSSITINKSGAGQIPQDPNNGWTYLGGPQTVNTVSGIVVSCPAAGAPMPSGVSQDSQGRCILNFHAFAQTGWVIQLHGSAVLTGTDQVSITYARP